MLYEAFCHFSGEHPEASFFQSDDLFRMILQQEHVEAILLLAIARTTARGAAGKDAEPTEEETSLFPGGALLFRGRPAPEESPAPANTQQPTPNTQHPTATTIPGVGRTVGSLLALGLPGRSFLGRRVGSRTVVFGGPLLADGSRLDRETRLRNLLNALTRRVKKTSAALHVHNFHEWGELSPVFTELGFKPDVHLRVLKDWETIGQAVDASGHVDGNYRYEPGRMKQYLENAVSGNPALRRVSRPLPWPFS